MNANDPARSGLTNPLHIYLLKKNLRALRAKAPIYKNNHHLLIEG